MNAMALIVSQSLDSVRKCLKRAARNWTNDDEHVHRLRVATRRSLAAVKLFDSILPNKQRRWLNKNLKDILHAAGEARDLDVLLKNGIQGESGPEICLLKMWTEERNACQKPIRRLDREIRDKLKHHSVALRQLQSGDPGPTDTMLNWLSLRHWISDRVSEFSQRFLMKLSAASDVESLHRLRIETKRLRYTLDLIRPGLDPSEAESLNSSLSGLQDVLGNFNDQVVALKHLKRSAKHVVAPSDKQTIARLIEKQTKNIAAQFESVGLWLDSDESEQLRRRLQSFVSRSSF